MSRQFEDLPTPVDANRDPNKMRRAEDRECGCGLTGKIIAVEETSDLTIQSMVRFIPQGSDKACELRVAAFIQAEKIVEKIEKIFLPPKIPSKRALAAESRLLAMICG